MSRKKIVAGNWKMHKTVEEGQSLVTEIRGILRDEMMQSPVVIVCPPYTHLYSILRLCEGTELQVGAQNCHWEKEGAFTGEISTNMLKEMGVTYVIIGHSERRQYFGETNLSCAQKITSALKNNLQVIYCVGETLQERESGNHFNVIATQLAEGLSDFGKSDIQDIIIAYEPVWAIGTGKTASPEQAQEVHAFIRAEIAKKFDTTIANNVSILYGGSVKPDNASTLFSQVDIDGGLIGGAALKARDFVEIVKACK